MAQTKKTKTEAAESAASAKKTVKKTTTPKKSTTTKKTSTTKKSTTTKKTTTKKTTQKKTAPPAKKIMFVASECLPFCATGGLGEVIGSLPPALASLGCEVSVFVPLYKSIGGEYREKMEFLKCFDVHVAWRTLYCGVFRLVKDGVSYYFIDNEYYFGRDGLYGHFDDAERYAFFCTAVLECWNQLSYVPDVVHAHDWQTALIPIYLNAKYYYPDVKTVFTIHNIEYQGKYDPYILGDVFGLGTEALHFVEYEGCINLMKGAIACSNKVTTVSPSYAGEIQTEYFAHGLDKILREHNYKLAGILNGIDEKGYDPRNGELMVKKFSSDDLSGKEVCKAALQKEAGLPEDANIPVVAMITRLVAHKGLDLVMNIADELLTNCNCQLIILGTGDKQYEDFFKGLEQRHPDKMKLFLAFDKALARRIYSGADIFLMPSKSEPCGLAQMIASRYGTVPIVRKTGGLGDSIQDCGYGEGNGFVFDNYNAQEMLHTIYRAITLFHDKDNFENLKKHIMNIDFSWSKSGTDYLNMYNNLI